MATIGFKGLARYHQIMYRQEVLKTDRGEYETFLSDADSMKGLILFNGFGIFERAKERYNPLLGESMTRINQPESRFSHFISVILYPKGNDHFRKLIPSYSNFLTKESKSKFVGITFEKFLHAGRELVTDPEYLRWLQYLEDRYNVKNR